MEGHDSVQTSDGRTGIAVFDANTNCIFVSGEVAPELQPISEFVVLTAIACEYMRFMQKCDNKPYDEIEVSDFARNVVKEIVNISKEGIEV